MTLRAKPFHGIGDAGSEMDLPPGGMILNSGSGLA